MKSKLLPSRRQSLQAVTVLASAAALHRPAAAGETGACLVVSHKVQDYDRWLPVFQSTSALKKTFGWKQSTVYSIDGDRNNIMVVEEFGSLEKAKAFAAAPELKEAMGKAGVAGPPEVRFVSPVKRVKA